ncbi:amino acid ABC transporter permease [Alloyangia pacifica]|uniref:Polar amino acid transport system permease protein n=1 Tax=Alloyangia pacifica TaxID=311180 RepID=A0A1I6UZ89_9RHOB|nr:amino acid ABC transporter permease [Alloyangia pacifica]SDI31616.1 polar amino acid transport system permease protein [Alloyangia pacifica]SFT06741.1 polar amino acid transport system permease protein [Alloyangia pacifica]
MNWNVVTDNAGLLLEAFGTTLWIAGATIVLSVVLAFPLAVMRDGPIRGLRILSAVFSWVMRATPALTLLFLTYFGLPQVGIYLAAVPAAIAGLTLSATGYNMEYIRAGLRAVPSTQYEAARALGMPFPMILRRVIVPQAIRTIMPPLTSNLTLVMKGSSLAGMVAVTELTGAGMALISRTYQPFEILIVIGLAYLILNGALIWLQHRVENWLSLPGQG